MYVYMSVPASPAVHNDGIVACLHLHPAHLVDEVNHAGSTLGSSSLWPGKEVELTHGPRLAGLHLMVGQGREEFCEGRGVRVREE